AIHVTPEAVDGGAIAKVRDGDLVRVDAVAGTLEVLVPAAEWAARTPVTVDLSASHSGVGRELFAPFRNAVGQAEKGASIFAFA
ncbi:dihydroxy-acid dehydratase, partial [Xanthobacter oligotrophicus]|uniref:dihydroxy-acid dehydratase domain-containing protein n=1 Tax=Xanthobacter oligotrophicus TaxID=2607286 RepID=UPI00165D58C2